VLAGYAYETIPNKSIVTGKTKGLDELSNVAQLSPAALRAPTHQPASLGLFSDGSACTVDLEAGGVCRVSAIDGEEAPGTEAQFSALTLFV
jgi:hypothetical protein